MYMQAFLEAGGEGIYDENILWLRMYLRGGVEEGVRVLDRDYQIISLMMESKGDLIKGLTGDWSLNANTRIGYHVDLWPDDISGSVNWQIHNSF